MPTLDWIGKKAVVNHHREVPFHILKEDERLSYGKKDSGNLIVEGDNLVALKALLPYYAGKVKCIYIDPPYNTGDEKWVYNDNVNSPEIKKWLGQVVGKESEDLSRHDKWLCMMYPRLQLLREFLSDDGAIFISIDDNELAALRLICDEIFLQKNFVGQWHWFKSATPPNLSHKIKKNIEYVIAYEKNKNSGKYTGIKKISKSDDPLTKPQNSLKTLFFPPNSIHFKTSDKIIESGIYGTKKFPNHLLDDLIIKDGLNLNGVRFENRFIWLQEKLEDELNNNTRINCSESLVLSYKKQNYSPEVPPNLIDERVGVDTTEEAGKQLAIIFNNENVFEYPKSTSLIEYIINFLCDKNSLILDSFAGSGTTAHAVIKLNQKDRGERKFILIQLPEETKIDSPARKLGCNTISQITRERVKRVIDRDGLAESTGFKFAKLGEAMHSADGDINPNIKYADLARHIFFMATGTPLAYETTEFKTPLIGISNGVAIYLLYNGILGDESVNGGNRLTQKILKELPKHDGVKIIYGTACGLSETMLRRHNIVFRQIPYSIFDK